VGGWGGAVRSAYARVISPMDMRGMQGSAVGASGAMEVVLLCRLIIPPHHHHHLHFPPAGYVPFKLSESKRGFRIETRNRHLEPEAVCLK
jgi:hypothetical protein